MIEAHRLWTSLAPAPLLWLTLTLGAFLVGSTFQRVVARGAAWASPVLIAMLLLIAVLLFTRTPYSVYFSGAQFIHFLLGPVTVALGVPLARNIGLVRASMRSLTLALLAGSVASVVFGYLCVRVAGGSEVAALSMAPKAVTTPIAMSVAQSVGGSPPLTAVLAIIGGILAAVVGQPLLRAVGVKDWSSHGLAAGLAGSGVAAAEITRRDPIGAAFAALGIGLNGLVTALLTPLLLRLLHR